MSDMILLTEEFNKKELDKKLTWFSPPKEWKINSECSNLFIKTDEKTDYWQRTHYGFKADNGHFLYYEVDGDFRVTTSVRAKPNSKYDQAGLMVRYSTDSWIKTSVEYIHDELRKLGVVVTKQGYSDWSSQEFVEDNTTLFYRITRKNNNYYVDYSLDGSFWRQIRMTHIIEVTNSMKVGIYACSPQGKGCVAEFDFIKIEKIDSETTVY